MLKKIMLLLFAALMIIQFFPPEKNTRTGETDIVNGIEKVLAVPADVHTILETSCYDCHSNDTEYPWYAEVQPVGWWINHHVKEGKAELNFDEFASYSLRRQYRKLEEINEEVKEGEMPLSSYTLIHKNAALTESQKLAIANWVSASMDFMKSRYPADSLLRKK